MFLTSLQGPDLRRLLSIFALCEFSLEILSVQNCCGRAYLNFEQLPYMGLEPIAFLWATIGALSRGFPMLLSLRCRRLFDC